LLVTAGSTFSDGISGSTVVPSASVIMIFRTCPFLPVVESDDKLIY
jgi:hypothetical protein